MREKLCVETRVKHERITNTNEVERMMILRGNLSLYESVGVQHENVVQHKRIFF